MICHAVHLFCCAVKLDGLTTFFVAARKGFSLVVRPLSGVICRVICHYFLLFRRVHEAMQEACFSSGRQITWVACICCLALSRAAQLKVRSPGGFSSLLFPAMTRMVGVCPNWSFRSCYTFVDFFCDFHYFK